MRPGPRSPRSWLPGALRRVLRLTLGWLITLLILFEEWGWEPLQQVLQRLTRWSLVRRIEQALTRLPPAAALAALLLPGLLLLPVKLSALWLIGSGHPVSGIGLIVLAKLVGTALVARIFTLTQPMLMRMGWFARLYQRWHDWKTLWMTRVRDSAIWYSARRFRRRVESAYQRRLAPHIAALRHRMRDWFGA
jgi:hypothetical protein